MHRRPCQCLNGLHVPVPSLAPASEYNTQPVIYFTGDLFMDRKSRFFSSAVHELLSGSIGRWRQIFSLTSISSLESCWKRWYSSISVCALRQAAGEGKDSPTVLPSTLRVSRICGSWPGSFGLAQWQLGLPQRRLTAQIAQGSELAKDLGSLSFQFLKRFGHSDDLLILSVSKHSEHAAKKEPESNHPLLCRAPQTSIFQSKNDTEIAF